MTKETEFYSVANQNREWLTEVYRPANLTFVNLKYTKAYVTQPRKKTQQLPVIYDSIVKTFSNLIDNYFKSSSRYNASSARIFALHVIKALKNSNPIGFTIPTSKTLFSKHKYPKQFFGSWNNLLKALVVEGYGNVFVGGLLPTSLFKAEGFSLQTKTKALYRSVFIPSDKCWCLFHDLYEEFYLSTEELTEDYTFSIDTYFSEVFDVNTPSLSPEDYVTCWVKSGTGKNSCKKQFKPKKKDLPLHKKLVEEMTLINNTLHQAIIECNGIVIDATCVRKFTVYSSLPSIDVYSSYGRLYNRVQNLPQNTSSNSYSRNVITINGKRVVELDFVSMHPALMLALYGVEVEEGFDVYNVDPDESPLLEGSYKAKRKLYKLALLMWMYSRKSPHGALKNAVDAISEETWVSTFGSTPRLTMSDCAKIIKLLKKANPDLVKAKKTLKLCPAKLQFLDSQIAIRVLIILAEKGIPCIPIHDSFLVEWRQEDALRDAMKQAWVDVMESVGGKGINCYLDKKADGNDVSGFQEDCSFEVFSEKKSSCVIPEVPLSEIFGYFGNTPF